MRKLQADHKQNNGTTPEDLCVMATGGGAFKYYDKITKALGVEVKREDEMECLIIGTKNSVYNVEVHHADSYFQASISSSTRFQTKSSPTAKKSP
jgi:pantothenate kinase